ncbi:hypothetical protein J4Q44_G00299750 [Coregonus suidteri]|uniref:Uncharacterized protein n=1 Tax=Coregonus suidteri TaxID=861788 RepID=A0AAN8KW65_9TELE
MGECISVRVLLMFLALISYLIALTFNILALFGPWTGAFMQTTQYVLSKSTTHLTPDRWVLFLWDVLNVWLIGMFIYLIHKLRRREAYTWMYTTPAVLPYGFYLSWIVNSMLNMAWLFLYDKEFVIENWYLDKHMRYILTVYPVVILVLSASVANPATPGTHIDIMSAVILAITSVIFIVRIIMVLWKHKNKPLYGEEQLMSPVDIARTQKLIFMAVWWDIVTMWFYMVCIALAMFWHQGPTLATQNGLATFGWWTLLEALDSLGLVPRYQASLPDPLVSSMVLTLLLLGMLIWFFFESFIFSKYICYTFTVYHVLIVGLEAMFTRGYHVQDLAPTQSTVVRT